MKRINWLLVIALILNFAVWTAVLVSFKNCIGNFGCHAVIINKEANNGQTRHEQMSEVRTTPFHY